MTKISKVLVVFVTVASVSFMGVAFINLRGGPNWEAEAAKMTGYVFENTGGNPPVWKVTVRRGDAGQPTDVTTTKVLAEAVVAARNDRLTRLQAEIAAATEPQEDLRNQIGTAKRLNRDHNVAMTNRENELAEVLKGINQQADAQTLQGLQLARRVREISDEAADRREDVFRLTTNLHEIQTDRYQIEEQRRHLQDWLNVMSGVLDRLESRNQQLSRGN